MRGTLNSANEIRGEWGRMKVCLRRAQVGAFGGHYSANREKLEGEANSLKLEMVRCWARAIMFTKRTTRTLMTLALFCVAACGTPSAPDDAALEAFIASQVQGQFEISINRRNRLLIVKRVRVVSVLRVRW